MRKDYLNSGKYLNSEQGFIAGRIAFLLGLVMVATVLFSYIFGYVVPPGVMGIRQITVQIPFGPKQGYSTTALEAGYHWSIPFYSYIHKIPRVLQIYHFSRSGAQEAVDGEQSAPTLEVQTSDGSSVDIDVSIFYHFFNSTGKDHGGPAELLTLVGASANWIDRIRTVAENELKDSLGKLSTSEFYNPIMREAQVEKALKEMNSRLFPLGIKIEDVLLRRYTYTEERIDRAIFEKNLQNQEERLNAASSRLADARAELERVAAEWDAKIETLRAEGNNKASIVRSEADLYEAQKKAEGDLTVAKAEAEADRLKAEVLNSGAASKIYVARKLVPLLKTLKGGVVSDVNPYEIGEWIKRFGIKAENASK